MKWPNMHKWQSCQLHRSWITYSPPDDEAQLVSTKKWVPTLVSSLLVTAAMNFAEQCSPPCGTSQKPLLAFLSTYLLCRGGNTFQKQECTFLTWNYSVPQGKKKPQPFDSRKEPAAAVGYISPRFLCSWRSWATSSVLQEKHLETSLLASPPKVLTKRLLVILWSITGLAGMGQIWLPLAMNTAASYALTSCSGLSHLIDREILFRSQKSHFHISSLCPGKCAEILEKSIHSTTFSWQQHFSR